MKEIMSKINFHVPLSWKPESSISAKIGLIEEKLQNANFGNVTLGQYSKKKMAKIYNYLIKTILSLDWECFFILKTFV